MSMAPGNPEASSNNGEVEQNGKVQRVRRKHEPDLDTVLPAEAASRPKDYRDKTMIKTLGLENDLSHWDTMKSAGIAFCRKELPPLRLSARAKAEKKIATNEDARRLEYVGANSIIKKWMWRYGLAEWKTKFEYDIKYLNRRYPKGEPSDLICGLFSTWNSDKSMNHMKRTFELGRNIVDLFTSIEDGEVSCALHTTYDLIKPEFSDNDGLQEQSTAVTSRDKLTDALSQCTFDDKHSDKSVIGVALEQVDWSRVIVAFFHCSSHGGKLVDEFAFHYVCKGQTCNPYNIDIDLVKHELLDEHSINYADYSLRLRNTNKLFKWSKKAMCELATHWSRVRGSSAFELPLELVHNNADDDDGRVNYTQSKEDDQNHVQEDTTMEDAIDTSQISIAGDQSCRHFSNNLLAPDLSAAKSTEWLASTQQSPSPGKRKREDDSLPASTKSSLSANKKQKTQGGINDDNDLISQHVETLEARGEARPGTIETSVPFTQTQANDAASIIDGRKVVDSDKAKAVDQGPSQQQTELAPVEEPVPIAQGITGAKVLDIENLKFEKNTNDTEAALLDRIVKIFPEGTVTLSRFDEPDANTVRVLKELRDRCDRTASPEFNEFCSFVQCQGSHPDQNPTHTHWTRERLEEIAYHCGFNDMVDFIRHPKWPVPQIPDLFREGCTPYWYQVVEAWQLFLTTDTTCGAFEGSMPGLGKTWTATDVIAINIITRTMREHWMAARLDLDEEPETLGNYHVCEGGSTKTCPTMSKKMHDSDRSAAGWRWFRCPCEYAGSGYTPPRPGYGAVLFLGQANSLDDSVLSHLRKVFKHCNEKPIKEIDMDDIYKKVFKLPMVVIRDEYHSKKGHWASIDRVALREPEAHEHDQGEGLEAPFEANGLIIVTSVETWRNRKVNWNGLVLGLVLMDEAHKVKGFGTNPMKVHTTAKCWYSNTYMAHSKYIAMSGSVVDQNTAAEFAGYLAMFEEMGEREARIWANENSVMKHFTQKKIMEMGALYRKCQDAKPQKTKGRGRVTQPQKRKSAREYDRLVKRFVHRVDLDTRMFGCPVAVDNGLTGTYEVKYTDIHENLSEQHYFKAKQELREATLEKLKKKNKGGSVTTKELQDAVEEAVGNNKSASLAAWFPDISGVGSEYYHSEKQHYNANPQDTIEVNEGHSTRTIPWAEATKAEQDAALRVDWKVKTISAKGWWTKDGLKKKQNPFMGRQRRMLKAWIRSCPLLTYLRWTCLEWAFQDAVTKEIRDPQILITCIDPTLAIVVHQWLEYFVKEKKKDNWYIGDGRDVTNVLWLSGNLDEKTKKEAMTNFQEGLPAIMVSTPSVVACGHDLANVPYHIIVGEENDLSRFLQLIKRNVRLASGKAAGTVIRVSTGVSRERNVRQRRMRKMEYKMKVVQEQRELLRSKGGKGSRGISDDTSGDDEGENNDEESASDDDNE